MKKIILLLIMLISYSFSFDKVSLEYGHKENVNIYGISLVKNFEYKLFDLADLSLEVTAQNARGDNDDLFIISTQPLLTIDLLEKLYFEAGVGVAYFSKEYLDHKRFGMNFQFKESIGFGYKFTDNIEATLKYNHYSNADLASENAGLDFIGLRVIYSF